MFNGGGIRDIAQLRIKDQFGKCAAQLQLDTVKIEFAAFKGNQLAGAETRDLAAQLGTDGSPRPRHQNRAIQKAVVDCAPVEHHRFPAQQVLQGDRRSSLEIARPATRS